jgi:hypothetical protein
VVTAVQDLCLEGTVDAFLLCSGTGLPSLILYHIEGDSLTTDSNGFGPSSFFDVFVDITIDGGPAGTASLDGTVTSQFTPEQAVIAEPATVLLNDLGAQRSSQNSQNTKPLGGGDRA